MHEGLMVNDLYRTLCDGELLHTNICALSCLTINPVTVTHTHTHTLDMKFVSVRVMMMMICLIDLIDYDVIQVKLTYHSVLAEGLRGDLIPVQSWSTETCWNINPPRLCCCWCSFTAQRSAASTHRR